MSSSYSFPSGISYWGRPSLNLLCVLGMGVGGLSLLFNLKSQICRLEQSASGLDTEECTSLGDLALSWVQRLDGASGFRLSPIDCLCEEYENLWQRLNNCLSKPFSPGHYTIVTWYFLSSLMAGATTLLSLPRTLWMDAKYVIPVLVHRNLLYNPLYSFCPSFSSMG